MTFVGLILCILPGIAVIFLTSFTLYFVIDQFPVGFLTFVVQASGACVETVEGLSESAAIEFGSPLCCVLSSP